MSSAISVIPFMRFRKVTALLSVILVTVSIGSLATKHLALGLDFTGGLLVEVAYDRPAELVEIRKTLADSGYADAVVQHFGKATDVLVRVPPQASPESALDEMDKKEQKDKEATLGDRIYADLKQASGGELVLKRVEFVGPQIGDELRDQSGVAMLFALACMLIYVTLRFKLKFALGAVAALFHDVLIVLGFFSIFGIQFDLTVLAAVLAVIGYSLNDTIVVSDRIRENFRLLREGEPMDIVNESLTQTLSRTVMTSMTTLLVLLALLLLGGELIRGFATALTVGVVVGTYSSIYVASNVVLAMNVCREDFLEIPKEEIDDRP